jgi:uncharacterized protein YndB with AHSA1/START domain
MPTSAGSSLAQSAGLTLEIKRVLPARPSVVFRAFSDPDELATWWGPRGSVPRARSKAIDITFDFRSATPLGGGYRSRTA